MVKLSEKEKAAHKAAFQAMSPAEKAEHIFTYHKWTILLVLLILLVLVSTLHRHLTQKKPVLYMAVINVSFGEDMEKRLTEDFLTKTGSDTRRQEVYLYRDLYLSEDADALNHEYAYASKMKLSSAITAGIAITGRWFFRADGGFRGSPLTRTASLTISRSWLYRVSSIVFPSLRRFSEIILSQDRAPRCNICVNCQRFVSAFPDDQIAAI